MDGHQSVYNRGSKHEGLDSQRTGLATRATAAEVDAAINSARQAGCTELLVLKCTSAYPTTPTDSNLATIPHLAALTGGAVGLSDHTQGIGAAVASVAFGAVAIEKHVTLSRADDTVDAAFSLEPHELAQLVVESRRAWEAIGTVHYGPTDAERDSLRLRRSLYIVEDIAAGEELTRDNVRSIRPGYGLPPGRIEDVLGLHVARDVARGTALRWHLLRG